VRENHPPAVSRHSRGLTLLELVISTGILGGALLGILGTLLAVQGHNQSAQETRLAYKACEDTLERLLALPYDEMLAKDGATFVADLLHPFSAIGAVEVQEMPGAGAEMIARVTARIRTSGETIRPLDVSLTTWRHRR